MDELGKWADFAGNGYEITNLGRPLVFLIPSFKLELPDPRRAGKKIKDRVHEHLGQEFGAFTSTALPYFGFWKNKNQQIVYDQCVQYEVSFNGKEQIRPTLKWLADLASDIDEDCLYVKAGQYTCLIWPKP